MRTQGSRSGCCPIIVLGAERSGTSVVTEMIHRWGAYAGEPGQLTTADKHNLRGYWEYSALWDFLAELGEFAKGASWWDASFQAQVEEKCLIPRYRDKALALVAAMEKEGRPWVWKDPALSFFLPFWKAIWGDAIYVIMVRHPYDTALSWQRFVMPLRLESSVSLIAGNLLRWQYMVSRILEHTEPAARKIFVCYEELIKDPWSQAHRLALYLDQSCQATVSDEARVASMAQAVHADLWHNRSQCPFDSVQEATDTQKALYRFIERKIQAPHMPFRGTDYPMPPGWREFIKNEEALVRELVKGGS